MNNFIVQFEKAFSPVNCQEFIQKFNQDPRVKAGETGAGVDKTKKNSQDLTISNFPEWQTQCNQINNLILQGLIQYTRVHPHFVIGAISTKFQDTSSGEFVELTPQHLQQMSDQQIANILNRIYQLEPINMQRYEPKVGGYPYLHSEHFPHPNDPQQRSLHRVLLWLMYLNDVEQGGETEFPYQQLKIKPVTGNLILSPCGFTHTHCGHPPLSNEKYVLASWVGFKPANQIYG